MDIMYPIVSQGKKMQLMSWDVTSTWGNSLHEELCAICYAQSLGGSSPLCALTSIVMLKCWSSLLLFHVGDNSVAVNRLLQWGSHYCYSIFATTWYLVIQSPEIFCAESNMFRTIHTMLLNAVFLWSR